MVAGRHKLAAFDFLNGCLTLTEAGSKKRVSLYLVHGVDALARKLLIDLWRYTEHRVIPRVRYSRHRLE